MVNRWRLLLLIAVLIALAGCASATPTPDPDGPILTGFNKLNKSLATVFLSPTPNAAATLDGQRPTETPMPPTLTPSPTPYVGVFMGAPTRSVSGIIPTSGAYVIVITMTPEKGTKVAANGGSSSNPTPPQSCAGQSAPVFANALKNPGAAGRLGCATGAPYTVKLVAQPFQNGFMFWRDTQEIYVVSTAGIQKGAQTDTFWRVPDKWNESLPANDPALTAPEGLLQPVRGFGYVWRGNAAIRNSLGWALSAEQPYDSTWQDYGHGWMMTTSSGTVLAMIPLDGSPVTTGLHFGVLPQ